MSDGLNEEVTRQNNNWEAKQEDCTSHHPTVELNSQSFSEGEQADIGALNLKLG